VPGDRACPETTDSSPSRRVTAGLLEEAATVFAGVRLKGNKLRCCRYELWNYVALGGRSCATYQKNSSLHHITLDATEEIKLGGYRAIAVKAGGRVNLFSRRHKSFNRQYPRIVEALDELPEGRVVDGEVVALDEAGRPNFNLLQNLRSKAQHIHYFIFDLLICNDRDLTKLPLSKRRELMKSHLKPLAPRIRIADQFEVAANDMLAAVRQQGLEGVIGKRKDSFYEAGKRTGAWVKCRVNRGQELVIGGYIPGPHGFDSLIVGYYQGKDLVYVARVRNGFVLASRRQVFEKIRHLVSPIMPFANLPDTHKSRWGDELTAEEMKECVWLRPETVAQVEFLEWTEADRLRHSKFAGLREDKDPRQVVKEQ
jgi:DNA ligase D-like protein (predicted ligase)